MRSFTYIVAVTDKNITVNIKIVRFKISSLNVSVWQI